MRQRLVFVHTAAEYLGDTVTVMGVRSARLLAVAGCNTPRQLVLGLITVRGHEQGQTTYTVSGYHGELADLEAAAAVLVEQRTRSSRPSGRQQPSAHGCVCMGERWAAVNARAGLTPLPAAGRPVRR